MINNSLLMPVHAIRARLVVFTALLKLLLVLNEHNSQDFNLMLRSVWLILRYTYYLMT